MVICDEQCISVLNLFVLPSFPGVSHRLTSTSAELVLDKSSVLFYRKERCWVVKLIFTVDEVIA